MEREESPCVEMVFKMANGTVYRVKGRDLHGTLGSGGFSDLVPTENMPGYVHSVNVEPVIETPPAPNKKGKWLICLYCGENYFTGQGGDPCLHKALKEVRALRKANEKLRRNKGEGK